MPDYGRRVAWPPNPPVLDRAAMNLHKIHNTWKVCFYFYIFSGIIFTFVLFAYWSIDKYFRHTKW
jgi:hypothetical protein